MNPSQCCEHDSNAGAKRVEIIGVIFINVDGCTYSNIEVIEYHVWRDLKVIDIFNSHIVDVLPHKYKSDPEVLLH